MLWLLVNCLLDDFEMIRFLARLKNDWSFGLGLIGNVIVMFFIVLIFFYSLVNVEPFWRLVSIYNFEPIKLFSFGRAI